MPSTARRTARRKTPGEPPGETHRAGHRGDGGQAETVQGVLDVQHQSLLVAVEVPFSISMLEEIGAPIEVEEETRQPRGGIVIVRGMGCAHDRREAAAPLRQPEKSCRISSRVVVRHDRPAPHLGRGVVPEQHAGFGKVKALSNASFPASRTAAPDDPASRDGLHDEYRHGGTDARLARPSRTTIRMSTPSRIRRRRV